MVQMACYLDPRNLSHGVCETTTGFRLPNWLDVVGRSWQINKQPFGCALYQ